jgi:hypothetical protein
MLLKQELLQRAVRLKLLIVWLLKLTNSSPLEQIVTTFNLRVVAAGGTFEAVNCCQTIITDLQNINID